MPQGPDEPAADPGTGARGSDGGSELNARLRRENAALKEEVDRLRHEVDRLKAGSAR